MAVETRANKPSIIFRMATKMPAWMLTRTMAETIMREMPTQRATAYVGEVRSFGAVIQTEIIANHWPAPFGVGAYYSEKRLALAIRAFGKYTSQQARDKLVAGIVDWHAQFVLVSKIDDSAHALAVIRGGKVSDHDMFMVLASSTDNELYTREVLTTYRFEHPLAGVRIASRINDPKIAMDIMLAGIESHQVLYQLARKIDGPEDAKMVLKARPDMPVDIKEILLAKIDPEWKAHAVASALTKIGAGEISQVF